MEVLMKKMLLAILLLVLAVSVFGQSAQYVGAEKCKMCHMSKAKGDAYGVWKASKHAQAFATLATEAAKAAGKKAGVDDPQKSPKCLKCHVTAAEAAATAKAATFAATEGVGCEACHGPGSLYKDMKVMRALHAGTQDAKAVAYSKGDKTKCVKCHNSESPTFQGFNLEEMYKKIAHNMPKS
jgi:hypothetical protein